MQPTLSYVFCCILYSSSSRFLQLRSVVCCWYATRASITDRACNGRAPSIYPYAVLCTSREAGQGMLLLCSMQDALPGGGRRIGSEEGNPLLEQLRRSILRGELETLLELLLSPIPITLTIGRQAMSEQITECKRVWYNLAGPTHELKDPDWFGLSHYRHEVQLTYLHSLLGQAIGILSHDNPRPVHLVNPLKA